MFPIDAGGAARLRAVLREAGYTASGIEAAVGADLTPLGHRGIPVLVQRTRGGGALGTLVRLFLAGVPVAAADAERALRPLALDDLAAWGLLRHGAAAGTVEAAVQLCHHGDLLLAVDLGPASAGLQLPADHVMGLSASTLLLARMTDRAPAVSALDVGTGCGIQALLAAEHSERVVATDVNPRAVAMTRLNALLNGVENVEPRHGDLLDPVAGERFDLVVSNPPFVVGPRIPQLYLAGGPEAGDVCARLARGIPALLEPGGRAHMLANWAPSRGVPWQEHVGRWFEDCGCDVWVIRRDSEPVDTYAAVWVESEADDVAEFPGRFDAWMRWYAERGIETVDLGMVTLRRRLDGATTVRCEDLRHPWDQVDGDGLALAFRQRLLLDSLDDTALLACAPRLAGSARLRRECVAVGREWVGVGALLSAEDGLGPPGGIDPLGERLVAACDGAMSLGDLVAAMAAAAGAEVAEILPGALAAVRRLVERGVLLLPEG